jgi:hypothetical protein
MRPQIYFRTNGKDDGQQMNTSDWTATCNAQGEIEIRNASGLVATIHQAPYTQQIVMLPDLYKALDKLTDITSCAEDLDTHRDEWLYDLADATREALIAIAKAKGETSDGL